MRKKQRQCGTCLSRSDLAVGGEHGVEFEGSSGNHARLEGRTWRL